MVDRKTVIKGVECCSRQNNTNLCGECPYNKSETRFGCMHRLMTDVFALLKEQDSLIEIARSQGWSDGWSEGYDECEREHQENM